MPEVETLLLNHQQIKDKIRRIAFQIYENNVDETTIVLAGIEDNGYVFAQMLKDYLDKLSPLDTLLCRVTMDKKNPLSEIKTSLKKSEYQGKSIVLVDDVLNSGSTLIYGVRHFLEVPLKQFNTAVLVNRNHKKFPIKADFKGISLSTSLNEHIMVELNETNSRAYLR